MKRSGSTPNPPTRSRSPPRASNSDTSTVRPKPTPAYEGSAAAKEVAQELFPEAESCDGPQVSTCKSDVGPLADTNLPALSDSHPEVSKSSHHPPALPERHPEAPGQLYPPPPAIGHSDVPAPAIPPLPAMPGDPSAVEDHTDRLRHMRPP